MANQVEPGTVEGAVSGPAASGSTPEGRPAYVGQAPGSPVAPYVTFHGRTVSWVAVSTIMVGFLVGGLGLAFDHHGPIWWLFWLGVGLAALGALTALATGIFDDWY
jgi:hypothetical protein